MDFQCFCLLPFNTEDYGGYVSENKIALEIYYCCLAFKIRIYDKPKPLIDFPTGIPQDKWNRKFNKQWLHVHDLDMKGNANDLSERVSKYMSM